MKELTFFSPAKLNLFFRILRKRTDGYHEIISLMQAIDLGDDLTVSLSSEDKLTCDDPTIPCDHHNLVIKALQLYRNKTNLQFCAAAVLKKRIPPQAGLGGGSSNAATMLWALNELHNRKVSLRELVSWGAELGSDVPFFFSNGTARCTGRGEVLENASLAKEAFFWIAKPSFGCETPHIFKHVDLNECDRTTPKEQFFVNDLETVALKLYPQLENIKQRLLGLGFTYVAMTGSGSAFMCIGPISEPELQDITFFPSRSISKTKETWYEKCIKNPSINHLLSLQELQASLDLELSVT